MTQVAPGRAQVREGVLWSGSRLTVLRWHSRIRRHASGRPCGDAWWRARMSDRRETSGQGEPVTKMRRKEYEEELRRLQVELVQMQRWVVQEHAKVCIVFEGRDTAGKGGVIKRLTERVSPRVFRVVALPAPNERERSQMYIQRYIPHLPAGGEVVIFDRSWYNRAGVELVMGFCTQEESARFLQLVPFVEQAIVDSGVILLKYWLEVSQDEQTRRLTARIDDGRKTWKLSAMDLDSYGRWYDYSRARDAMFAATDTETAPWYVANSDDKRRARLNVISHILDLVPYEREKETHVVLPAARRRVTTENRVHTHTRCRRGSDPKPETATSRAARPLPEGRDRGHGRRGTDAAARSQCCLRGRACAGPGGGCEMSSASQVRGLRHRRQRMPCPSET